MVECQQLFHCVTPSPLSDHVQGFGRLFGLQAVEWINERPALTGILATGAGKLNDRARVVGMDVVDAPEHTARADARAYREGLQFLRRGIWTLRQHLPRVGRICVT
jgi:hypothetical protein